MHVYVVQPIPDPEGNHPNATPTCTPMLRIQTHKCQNLKNGVREGTAYKV